MGRKTRGGIFAYGVLCCLTALGLYGRPTATDAASPVWAIHGDHNTVYLAGSVHLLKANDSALPAAFDRAYAGSQSFVMEIDLGKADATAAAG